MGLSPKGLLSPEDEEAYLTKYLVIYSLPVHATWCHIHGGTTEEGNCSYLLPRAAAAGSKRHKYGRNTQSSVYEITWFLVYRMDETRSQLNANNGILVCLVLEIWQFKLFAGKEVTAVPATRGEGGYWRRGRRLLCLCLNWIALSFLKHLK